MSERYETVVVGTGFGGAITACRTSKRWPNKVLVLERGKRYALGSFPRTPRAMSQNFWNSSLEKRARPGNLLDVERRGMFDVRNYKHMDVVLGAGLGGGSLIYANVFLEPPDHVFDERWPDSARKKHLMPYYRVAKSVLGSRPIPAMDEPRRKIVRTELFQKVADRLGRDSSLLDLNVFFGNEFDKPLPIGIQAENRYGAVQTSCTYCAECDIGCNYQAKNTLDLNYLYVAEQRYGASIRTEHLVDKIVPANDRGGDDPSETGAHGYAIYFRDLANGNEEHRVLANRVVVSAGALGSTELLMRCRDVLETLPRVSRQLGQRFSGNGDFLSFVVGTRKPADPNYGPVITQRIDFDLFDRFDETRAFIMEDASYPALLAWFVEGEEPGVLKLNAMWNTIRQVASRLVSGRSVGRIGYALSDLLSGDLSYHTAVLLCMGLDRSNGVMRLDRNGWLDLDWPYRDSLPLYEGILEGVKQFRDETDADVFFPLPTWLLPFRKNITVHALGGCVLADNYDQGVTSAARATFGEVFGYDGLFVADGAIVPTAVGANPTATIAALSEMVAEGMTGNKPDAEL